MSTDLQKYSTENQLDTIRRYAEQRGYTIVRVFEDSGRSGLRMDGRDGLQSLMLEVQSGAASFQAILVYDVTPQTPKRLKGMTAEAIARMARELSRLQETISSIQDSYGQDHLHLTVVKGYLRKLITNDRVARYLEQYQPELFIEFQKIAEMTSTLPSEAA